MKFTKFCSFCYFLTNVYTWGVFSSVHRFQRSLKRSSLLGSTIRSLLPYLEQSISTPLAIGCWCFFCRNSPHKNFELLLFTSIHFSYPLTEADRSRHSRHYCHAHALVVATHLRMAIAQSMLTLIGFEGAIAPAVTNPQLNNFAPGVTTPQLHRRNPIASFPCSAWACATAAPAWVVVMERPAGGFGRAIASWVSRLALVCSGRQWAIAPDTFPILEGVA